MDAAYEPGRVIQLSRRTREAIDALEALVSTDPAAAEAVRTIRLTRGNLEDRWMPALRDIEGSDIMVRWRASQLPGEHPWWRGSLLQGFASALPEHLRPGDAWSNVPTLLSGIDDAAVLGQLDWLERKRLSGGRVTNSELNTLARELALRVDRDREFERQLGELAPSNMLVGRLLARADFPVPFISRVVTRMATPNGPDTSVDPDRYARSLDAALTALASHPGACLDLLMSHDPNLLYTLGNWERLDQKVVTEFMVAGLHEAVELEPQRLADGYRVLQGLTVLANNPLDRRISPGVALGFATSMGTYLDTLSRTVDYSADTAQFTVSDRPRGVDAPFGTYLDVKGLFGVMLRHGESRAVLGGVTADWTTSTLRDATSQAVFTNHLTAAANFSGLLIAASDAEQEQMVNEAADEEKEKQKIGDFLGFVVDGALQAKRVSPAVRKTVRSAIDAGTDWIARTDPKLMPGQPWGQEIHRRMVVTAISMGIEQPDFFGVDDEERSLTPAQRRTVVADLATIDREQDPERRETLVNTMTSHIDGYAPSLMPALNAVEGNAAASKLTGS